MKPPAAGRLTHPLAAEPPGTTFHLLNQYSAVIEATGERLHLKPSTPDPGDRAIVERLVNIFHRMIRHEESHIPPERRPNQGVWEMMRHEFHGELVRLLHEGDLDGLEGHLRDALRRRVAIGLGPGPEVFAAFSADAATQLLHVVLIRDRLVSLSTAIGALPVENPEQGGYGEHMRRSSEELIRRVQVKLGVEIWRPPVMGLFGLDFDGAVVDVRAPEDAYCAERLRALAGADAPLAVVAEIGAGFGGLVLQCRRAGFLRCMAFDLPLINILQGYFLMRVFGPDQVALFGEDDARRPVTLLPYWEFENPAHVFDLVVNRDSLPEMPPPAAIGYLREVERRRVPLLSINQETQAASGQAGILQLHVGDLAATHTALRRESRTPYWLRRGYVEEVYRSDGY